jgi:recombination protein RecR
MHASPLLEQLITQLRCLPGVGPKSAQRMAYYLLARDRTGGKTLADTLKQSMEQIQHCQLCRNFSELLICTLCSNLRRNGNILCIVESAADLAAIEQTGYRGLYFVLMGHLSPIDGIGPQHLGVELLQKRLKQGEIQEVILATNPTVEGEATAHYLAQLIKPFSIRATRIAHGVPIGGELEYMDGNTLARALADREAM